MTLFEKSTSMQIIPFPAHYQLGYHNFDFSSFSRISCLIRELKLSYKTIFSVIGESFSTMRSKFFNGAQSGKAECVTRPFSLLILR